MRWINLYIFLFGSFFLLNLSEAWTQSYLAEGSVIDSATSAPLSYARVMFRKEKRAVLTDEDGQFSLKASIPIDTLEVSFLGFKTQIVSVSSSPTPLVFLLVQDEIMLNEVVIIPEERENPAHPIIRKAIANKSNNDRSKLDAYQFEAYEKTEIDIYNFDEKVQKQLIFKPIQFVFSHIDTAGGTPYLPMFLTETLKDVYYRKDPKALKEVIQATQTSGVENVGFSQLLNNLYENISVYENNLDIFDKSFVSPISDVGFKYYQYYLMDSMKVGEHFCYHIFFRPKRKQELTLTGDIYLTQKDFAVKRWTAKMAEDANVNHFTEFEVNQIFEEVGPAYWMIVHEGLQAKAAIFIPHEARTQEFLTKKYASYRSFKLNEPLPEEQYQQSSLRKVAKKASKRSDEYWISHRHDTLSVSEQAVYSMVDSIKQAPLYKLARTLVRGYADLSKFEIGPLFTVYSFNPIEGPRFKLGGRTTKSFSKSIALNGYLAYGVTDEQFKFGIGGKYLVTQQPRNVFSCEVSRDVEQLGLSRNTFRNDNLLASIFRTNPATKLNLTPTVAVGFEHEWIPGISNSITFSRRTLIPLGDLTFLQKKGGSQPEVVSQLTTSELTLSMHIGWREKFLEPILDRISLGTPFPILDIQYTRGIQGLFDSDYGYHKLTSGIKQKIKIGRLGNIQYRLEAGKIFGTLPFPLLEVHTGNETLFYDDGAFNTMNFFEFVSDEYALGSLSYHMEGWLLNKVPLIRKLKWREVFSGKILVGRLSTENKNEMILPDFIYTLDTGPYAEASVGIENIFRFLRIEALWRLTYKENPEIRPFGVKFGVEVDF